MKAFWKDLLETNASDAAFWAKIKDAIKKAKVCVEPPTLLFFLEKLLFIRDSSRYLRKR
jgi:hypothetical protein